MSTALVLQMHRLGDLILSFPLLHRLRATCRNVWVVAEPAFFQPLLPVAPSVTFFPAAQGEALAASQPFELGINLSSRPASARILGGMQAGQRLGLAGQEDGLHVYGFWQLYRQALTQNNRGNPFHWSDLNVLDLAPDADIHGIGHTLPRPAGTGARGACARRQRGGQAPFSPFLGPSCPPSCRRRTHAALPGRRGGKASGQGDGPAQRPAAGRSVRQAAAGCAGRRHAAAGSLHHAGYRPHASGKLAGRAGAQSFPWAPSMRGRQAPVRRASGCCGRP